MMPPCPTCGRADRVVEIVYGMPGYELGQRAERGEIKLGGCCIDPRNATHHCARCDEEFGGLEFPEWPEGVG
jgi:hypothetical protein